MSSSTTFDSFRKIKLIRYLVAWRVNSSLVTLPECFAVELSHVLGSIIAGRLPTREAGRWQKALSSLDQYLGALSAKGKSPPGSKVFPEVSWPVDAVFFVYPGKTTYGLGELIFWELKLFGDGADHGFFLETILPAMEEAGYTSNEKWNRANRIWGRFDIHAVYAARGACWEPIVSDGRLDLRCQANASQWAEGLKFGSDLENAFSQLVWLTPFELEGIEEGRGQSRADSLETVPDGRSSILKAILDGLVSRLSLLAPGKRKAAEDIRSVLDDEGKLLLQKSLELAIQPSLLFKDLEAVPGECPGRWTGKHVFDRIPGEIIPCLELASILHIGKYTHFGCGTFTLA